MTHFLLKLAVIITFVLIVTSLAARTLGSTQLPNPALRGFTEGCEDKPQPCWYGIVPNITTVAIANDVLTRMGYKGKMGYRSLQYMDYFSEHYVPKYVSVFPFCEDMNMACGSDKVGALYIFDLNVYIFDLNGITLGNAILLFGNPQYIDVAVTQGLLVVFKYATVSSGGWDSPDDLLVFIKIENRPTSNMDIREWHGFIPFWKYCLYEPKHYLCFKP
jgi:hypothetical protein